MIPSGGHSEADDVLVLKAFWAEGFEFDFLFMPNDGCTVAGVEIYKDELHIGGKV